MSLLMFFQEPDGVLVLTDTLATTESGDPLLLVSKCAVVPHLEMVVAHTGIAQVGQRWSHFLQTQMLALDMLDHHVPAALRGVRDELSAEAGSLTMTSTVYHLGHSEDRGGYVGYVYRSEADFESEAMEPGGFRVKPEPRDSFECSDIPSTLEEMIALAVQLRTEQDSLPANERVWIGGELVMTSLAERVTRVSKVYRFEDFESQWLAMNSALHPGSIEAENASV